MATLIELQRELDKLSDEDRAGLVAHLLASIPSPSTNTDEEEANRRDAEIDSGAVETISFDQFRSEVGRR